MMGLDHILMTVYLGVLSFWDIKCKKLPTPILRLGMLTAFVRILAGSIISGPSPELIRTTFAALLGAAPGLLMTVLSFYTDKVGRGDGIVLMTMGVCESCSFAALIMCFACILLSVFSVVLMAAGKVTRKTRMPYIPFLTCAYLSVKLYEGSYIWI